MPSTPNQTKMYKQCKYYVCIQKLKALRSSGVWSKQFAFPNQTTHVASAIPRVPTHQPIHGCFNVSALLITSTQHLSVLMPSLPTTCLKLLTFIYVCSTCTYVCIIFISIFPLITQKTTVEKRAAGDIKTQKPPFKTLPLTTRGIF